MALVPRAVLSDAGATDPTALDIAANVGGDTVQPGEHVVLWIKNGDAAPHTLEIDDPRSHAPEAGQAFDPDVAIVVPAGGERISLPLDPARFAASDGLVHLSWGDAPVAVTLLALVAE